MSIVDRSNLEKVKEAGDSMKDNVLFEEECDSGKESTPSKQSYATVVLGENGHAMGLNLSLVQDKNVVNDEDVLVEMNDSFPTI
ncbi:hypothetical protein V6N12_071067 [Hibiscus sabdariffa]|uniref:Uncharacterized protein n=1 Tax=Hibiscus sabdariffa TaxID=183260 RepID=A0ABR2FIX6_9ROSI